MSELLQERAPDVAASAATTGESQGSQTATEYAFAHYFPIVRPSFATPPPLALTQSLLTSFASFINTQLQLEADAREVLPYVSQSCHTFLPISFSSRFRPSIPAPNL
jgi:hypothetical protein